MGFPRWSSSRPTGVDALKGISDQKVMELATCESVTKAHDCIIASPVGTGKTHVEATRSRFRVPFYRAADLVRTLTEARDERMLTLLYRRLRRVDLILDELGFVPFERAGGELPFDLLSERNEIHSTLVITNR
jgi:DNA replication protein DnaC